MALKRRSIIVVPLLIALFAILGGIYGPRVEIAAAATDSSGNDEIKGSIRSFTKVFDLVEQNFADPVNPDKAIYKGAIPGMLRTLDPHSNFFDPRDYQTLREDQKRPLLRRRHAGSRRAERQDHRGRAVPRFAGLQSRAAAGRRDHQGQREAHR